MKTVVGEPPQGNPFYSQLLAGIELACRDLEINLLVGKLTVDKANNPIKIPRMLRERHAEALILAGLYLDDALLQLLSKYSRPFILVDSYANPLATQTQQHDSVITDNVAASFQATKYLYDKGHRNIALLGTTPDAFPSIVARRQGYDKAVRELQDINTYYANSTVTAEEGALAMQKLLQDWPKVTAVVCANDPLAIAAKKMAHKMGRKLPEDLSIIGIDNIHAASLTTPTLTTMHIDRTLMGYISVQQLLNRITYPHTANITTQIHPQLIERDSVRAI